MIEVFHVRQNRARQLTTNTIAEVGDSILIAGREEELPFVHTKKKIKLHILLISPIGTIIDSDQVSLDETGLKKIYSFPITTDLYSGTYVLQIDGDLKRRDKINIKTNQQLLYRWILFYGINLENPNDYPINNFVADVMVPPNISPIQQVTKVDSNYQPSKLITDKEGNRWIRYYFPQIVPKEKITLVYRATIITRIVAYDITRIRGEEENKEHLYPETYTEHTKPEPFLESNHEEIIKITNRYRGHSPLSKILTFLKFVRNNLEYTPLNGDHGAAYAIEKRYGDCTEFSTLFVSLCRAANVPARLTTSIIFSDIEGWQYHSQAEFFANGIWFPIDPTLQHDTRYLFRNPGCIILQRGNTLGDSPIREVRYRFDDMNKKSITVHTHKETICDKSRIVGQVTKTPSENILKVKGTLFEDVAWKFSLPSLELEKESNIIEIRATAPETAPVHKPFSIPVHLYNRNEYPVTGTLRISFVRGGIYTNHLFPMKLEANSHEPKMVEIPATNFLGKTLIELIFQNENGEKLGYEQKKIHFQ